MTEREICERIVEKGDCKGIGCGPFRKTTMNEGRYCPVFRMCYVGADRVELAKQWLEEHEEE